MAHHIIGARLLFEPTVTYCQLNTKEREILLEMQNF